MYLPGDNKKVRSAPLKNGSRFWFFASRIHILLYCASSCINGAEPYICWGNPVDATLSSHRLGERVKLGNQRCPEIVQDFIACALIQRGAVVYADQAAIVNFAGWMQQPVIEGDRE